MAGALSLSLLAALLAMPIVSFAATPSWDGFGDQTLPAKIEVGAAAGYTTSIRNGGTSNISQLFVTAFFQQPFEVAEEGELVNPGAPGTAPVFAQVRKDGVPLVGACPATLTDPLVCDVGGLRAGQEATLIIAYNTAGTNPAGIHGWWQSNGTGSTFCEPGDNSQGDCLPFHVGPTTITNSGNFGGGFRTETGGVAETDGIGTSNLVSTRLTAPANQKNLVLTVADDGDVIGDPNCADCISDAFTAELHVGDGSFGLGISTVVIDYHKNLWKTVNFKKLSVLHFHEGDLVGHEIKFSSSCSGTTECATFSSLPGGHGRVTLYLLQNGFVKYH
jgi:hypothetical protein